MWQKTFQKTYSNVNPKAIWQLWTDVNNWPQWHSDLEACHLEGPFEVGNHFYLQPKGVKPVRIILTEIIEGKSFTDRTDFFGAKMYDTHEMGVTEAGVHLTSTITVKGPLAWLWVKLVAQNVAAGVPEEMDAVVKRARGGNG